MNQAAKINQKEKIMSYNYPRITKHYPKYVENHPDGTPINYGFFGYKGESLMSALRHQDIEGIKKAHELGWINENTPNHMQVLGAPSLLAWAKENKLGKTAKVLFELGFTE
jgi:hypothetical protein